MTNDVTEVTRRTIIDHFTIAKIYWSGRMDESDFLGRIFDLSSMQSTDDRFRDAAGDIYQHRVRNNDWEDDWVFYDSRINLLSAEDETFVKFLCETLHPVVRRDPEEVASLLKTYNEFLSVDGWILVEAKKISGFPVYSAERVDKQSVVFQEPTGWQKVDRQFQEVRLQLDSAVNEEQYQAIGLLCREVMITVAQEVYDRDKYPTADGVEVSTTDAKRMLEAIFLKELEGSTNREARAHTRASMNLAVALQHRRTADFRMAALCAEATSSIINIVALLFGRRGRVG